MSLAVYGCDSDVFIDNESNNDIHKSNTTVRHILTKTHALVYTFNKAMYFKIKSIQRARAIQAVTINRY